MKNYKQIQEEAKAVEGNACRNSDHEHTMATMPGCLEKGSITNSPRFPKTLFPKS